MFIGHYALGFASAKIKKSPSLATMLMAVVFLDLLWPVFVLCGIETFRIDIGNTKITPLNFESYPYSHSLLMALVWGLVFGLIYFLITKNKSGAFLLVGLVFSHWILDFITHRPDLPIFPWDDFKVGLGLWNYPVAESIIEIGMFIAGVFLYFNSAKHKRRIVVWALVITFLVVHLANLLGPPPPSKNAVTWSANLVWLFILWAWWAEKKTEVNEGG
ncbi:MAG: hypothetical protein JST43_00790 [Bacteroidetes bacterium]|nr:hypothetical protein [Bacteroidota bacterium]MBS1540706.1 hypothetical protein [Bacteroidota bacterium]